MLCVCPFQPLTAMPECSQTPRRQRPDYLADFTSGSSAENSCSSSDDDEEETRKAGGGGRGVEKREKKVSYDLGESKEKNLAERSGKAAGCMKVSKNVFIRKPEYVGLTGTLFPMILLFFFTCSLLISSCSPFILLCPVCWCLSPLPGDFHLITEVDLIAHRLGLQIYQCGPLENCALHIFCFGISVLFDYDTKWSKADEIGTFNVCNDAMRKLEMILRWCKHMTSTTSLRYFSRLFTLKNIFIAVQNTFTYVHMHRHFYYMCKCCELLWSLPACIHTHAVQCTLSSSRTGPAEQGMYYKSSAAR